MKIKYHKIVESIINEKKKVESEDLNDYEKGYKAGWINYEVGYPNHPRKEEKIFSDDFIKGYWDGFNDAKAKYDRLPESVNKKSKKVESEDLHADDNNLWSFRGNVFDHRMTQEQFNAFKSYIEELRYHTEYMSPQDEDYKKIKKELDDKYRDKLSFDPSKFTKTDMEVMLPEIKIVESKSS